MHAQQGFNVISAENPNRLFIFKNNMADLARAIRTDRPLRIISAGQFCTEGGQLTSDRPEGRPDHQLLYVKAGCLEYTEAGGMPQLFYTGTLLLLSPGVPYSYTYTPGTEAYWVHFNGLAAEAFLRQAGLSGSLTFPLGSCGDFPRLILQIIQELQLLRGGYESNCCGFLLQLLGAVSRTLEENSDDPDSPSFRLRPALEDLRCSLVKHPLSYYAGLCHLSASRFAHLFTRYAGQSFSSYVQQMQMERAKDLLANTRLRVSEVSESLGFADPLYFSRLFHRTTGLSPRDYRRRVASGDSWNGVSVYTGAIERTEK